MEYFFYEFEHILDRKYFFSNFHWINKRLVWKMFENDGLAKK